MLITLYLIQMNTYNSVKAPPKRGYSMVCWNAGPNPHCHLGIWNSVGFEEVFQSNQYYGETFQSRNDIQKSRYFLLSSLHSLYCILYHLIFQCLRDI